MWFFFVFLLLRSLFSSFSLSIPLVDRLRSNLILNLFRAAYCVHCLWVWISIKSKEKVKQNRKKKLSQRDCARVEARASKWKEAARIVCRTDGMKSIHLGILRLNLFINMKIPHIPRPPMPSSAAKQIHNLLYQTGLDVNLWMERQRLMVSIFHSGFIVPS